VFEEMGDPHEVLRVTGRPDIDIDGGAGFISLGVGNEQALELV
jgi:hypothetical protein